MTKPHNRLTSYINRLNERSFGEGLFPQEVAATEKQNAYLEYLLEEVYDADPLLPTFQRERLRKVEASRLIKRCIQHLQIMDEGIEDPEREQLQLFEPPPKRVVHERYKNVRF